MAQKKSEESVADQLWNEIKDLPIEMYSLPDQKVSDHVVKKGGTPDSVVLSLKSQAALPSLETALATQKQHRTEVSYKMKAEGENIKKTHPKYDMNEVDGGYIVVTRHVPASDKPELQDLPEFFISGKE